MMRCALSPSLGAQPLDTAAKTRDLGVKTLESTQR